MVGSADLPDWLSCALRMDDGLRIADIVNDARDLIAVELESEAGALTAVVLGLWSS